MVLETNANKVDIIIIIAPFLVDVSSIPGFLSMFSKMPTANIPPIIVEALP